MKDDASAAFAETMGAELEAAAGSAVDIPIGDRRYAIRGVLGEGGMGRVLEADDRQFARHVAIKQLKADISGEDGRRRFALEALVTGHLEHPGVPPVYERGVLSDGLPFYAMRLVRGRTLAEAMGGASTLAERMKLLPVIVRVAQTLAFAHERGVIHRDIKPENIVVGRHGESVVLDWGIAKVRGAALSDSMAAPGDAHGKAAHSTRHGAILGTPLYMAPEQASGDVSAIDERTDVFAIGGLLYQLLTGSAPYADLSVVETITRATSASYPPLDDKAREAPQAIREICKKAMARSPEDRYATAGALADALETFSAEAVVGKHSRVIHHLADVATVAGVLALFIGGAIVFHEASSFKAQGFSAWVPFAGIVGAALSIVEWRTRGRYRLGPLTLGLILAVFLCGLAFTVTAMEQVFNAARAAQPMDPNHASLIFFNGSHEALGGLSSASITAAIQAMFWGAAQRSTLLAKEKAQRKA